MITRAWRDEDQLDHRFRDFGHPYMIVITLALIFAAVNALAQDSPAALDQRWRDAGTEPDLSVYRRTLNVPAPHPGYWHCATAGNFRYCPCYPLPYTQWTDPETNNIGYFRYDFAPILYTGNSACGAIPAPCIDGQGGPNHTRQGIGTQPANYIIPLQPQPIINNYYPVPEAPTGLGAIWAMFNTPPPTFPGTNYPQHVKTNPVWVTAYNYKKPVMDADPGCQGGGVTPTPTHPPLPTPTPAPNPQAPYIEAIYQLHVTAGCNTNPMMFCPQQTLTRGQQAVWTWNVLHLLFPAQYPLVPPTCIGIFVDVPCPVTP